LRRRRGGAEDDEEDGVAHGRERSTPEAVWLAAAGVIKIQYNRHESDGWREADPMARRQPRPPAALSPAKFEDAVYVLHVFAKKTRKTSSLDIELGKKRYRESSERRK
jgi:hypothetical protein